jgi:RNA polymerase sigma-70 factor (ECF subfamily)
VAQTTEPSLGGLQPFLQAAQAGSVEALGLLLEQCRHYLLDVANRELDSPLQPKAGASDLVQETFAQAQRLFDRFQGRSERELLAWLRAILLHGLAELTRQYQGTAKRRLGREVALEALCDSAGELPVPAQDAKPQAAWVPESTDFGLAKRLDAAAEQTQIGSTPLAPTMCCSHAH